MHNYAGSAFDNCVTLTFDLLTSGTVCLPNLVLIDRDGSKRGLGDKGDKGHAPS